jgi:hypothetical protein
LAIWAWVIIEGTGREEGWAFVAVQGAVLAGEEFATAVLAHGSRAGGAVGFGCRHLGEEALKRRRKVLKPRVQRKTKKPNQIYYTGRRIHRCKEVTRKREKEKKKADRGI